MPRSKSGKKREKIDKNAIEMAVTAISTEGLSFREACRIYGIKLSTLHRHVKLHKRADLGKYEYNVSNAVHKVFPEEMELQLLCYIKQAARMHYGLTKRDLRQLAYQYAKANNLKYPERWNDNKLAGSEWMRRFCKKFSDKLSLRKPEATSLARSTSFNRHNVEMFFNNLTRANRRYGPFPPQRIYNVDETGLSTVHVPPKILAPKGIKQIGNVTSGERGQNVTLIAAINAIGNHLPPWFVFPRVHFKENIMLKGAPVGSKGGANPSGWSNEKLFLEWLDFFIEHVKPNTEEPILLILDNHESHVSIAVIEKARARGIKMLTFPPHTSHRLQPLDRTVFGSFKLHYNRAVNDWMCSNPGKPLSIYEVAEMVGRSFPLSFTCKNIISGFAATGIFPLNADVFTDEDFLCSYATDRPQNVDSNSKLPILTSPSTSFSAQVQTTPEILRPFPKAAPRKESAKGRKKGKSTILTETPDKNETAPLTPIKIVKKIDKVKKILIQKDSDEESDICQNECLSSDEDYNVFEELEEKEKEDDIIDIAVGKKTKKDVLALKNVKREVGQHVAFLYEDEVYPGKIVRCDDEGATISSMAKSIKSWKWPEKEDILTYPWEDILGSIDPPRQISKRGFYNVPQLNKLK